MKRRRGSVLILTIYRTLATNTVNPDARDRRHKGGQRSPERQRCAITATIDAAPVPMALERRQRKHHLPNAAFTHAFGYTHDDIPTLQAWWGTTPYPDPDYCRHVICQPGRSGWKRRDATARRLCPWRPGC